MPPSDSGVIVERFRADGVPGGAAAGYALGALTARLLDSEGGGLVLPTEGTSTAAIVDGVDRRLVTGVLRAEGDRLIAEVGLRTTARPDEVLVRATAEIDRFDLEALAARLVDALGSESGQPLRSGEAIPRLATVPAAVLPFFEGETFAESGRRSEARAAYQRAIHLDSTLAVAHFRLAVVEQALGLRADAVVASDRAVALSGRMTSAERDRMDAWRVYESGYVEQALPLFERLVNTRGPDRDAWLTLAEVRFHWGAQLGIPRAAADSAFTMLLGLVPGDADALQHRLRLIGPVALPDSVDALVRRLAQAHPSNDARYEAQAVSRLSRRSPLDASLVPWATSGPYRAESRRLTQLAASARVPWDLAPFIRSLPTTDEPIRAALRQLLIAQLAAASGRMQDARRELASLAERHPARALEYRVLLELASPVPPPRDTLSALRGRLRDSKVNQGPSHPTMDEVAVPGIYEPRRHVLEALLTYRLGESPDTGVAQLGREANWSDYAEYLRQERAGESGGHERRLSAMGPGRPEWHRMRPDPLSYLVGVSRWSRIQSLIALGRDEEALRWLGSIPDVGGYDLVYLPQAALVSAGILEGQGHRTAARSAYARALELWEHADPEFRPLVEEAQNGLDRMEGAGPQPRN